MDTFDSAASFAVNRTFSMRYRWSRAQIASADPQIDENYGAGRRSPKEQAGAFIPQVRSSSFFRATQTSKTWILDLAGPFVLSLNSANSTSTL